MLLFKLYLLLNILSLTACTSLNCNLGIVYYKLYSCSTVHCLQERTYNNTLDSVVPGMKCKFF